MCEDSTDKIHAYGQLVHRLHAASDGRLMYLIPPVSKDDRPQCLPDRMAAVRAVRAVWAVCGQVWAVPGADSLVLHLSLCLVARIDRVLLRLHKRDLFCR